MNSKGSKTEPCGTPYTCFMFHNFSVFGKVLRWLKVVHFL